MHPVQPHATSAGAQLNPDAAYSDSNTIRRLQKERREAHRARLQALDERDAARRLARWEGSRTAALRALRARAQLAELDEQLARLDLALAAEVAR
jgi:hypothetical protein